MSIAGKNGQKFCQQSVDLFTAPLDLQSCGPEVPEVVVTDHLPLGEPMGPFNAQLVRGEIGVIGVATRGAADVLLPADYTGRELRLACSLLVQIVRLRRQTAGRKSGRIACSSSWPTGTR